MTTRIMNENEGKFMNKIELCGKYTCGPKTVESSFTKSVSKYIEKKANGYQKEDSYMLFDNLTNCQFRCIIRNNIYVYEIHRFDRPVRIFYDIEKEYNTFVSKDNFNKIDNQIKSLFSNKHWYLLECHRKRENKDIYKISYHAISKCMYVDNFALLHTYIKEQKRTCYKHISDMIDESVYTTSHRKFRCWNSGKTPEDKNVFKSSYKTIKKSLPTLCHYIDDKCGNISYTIKKDTYVKKPYNPMMNLSLVDKKVTSEEIVIDDSPIFNDNFDAMTNDNTSNEIDNDTIVDMANEMNYECIVEVADLIDIKYIDDRKTWLNIIFACAYCNKHVNRGKHPKDYTYEYYDLCVRISKKSNKFKYDTFQNIWDKYKVGKITCLILYLYANKSNKYDEFVKIMKKYEKDPVGNRYIFMGQNTDFLFSDFMRKYKKLLFLKTKKEYELMMDEIQKCFGIIISGNNYYITKNYTSFNRTKIASFNTIKTISQQSFLNTRFTLEYKIVNKKPVVMRLIDLIKKDKKDRCLYDVGLFYPKQVNHNEYNSFTGLASKPNDKIKNQSKVDEIIWFIRHVIAGNNDESYKFIIQWICNLVLKPWEKTKVCLVLCSTLEQVGKSFFANFLSHNLLGFAYCSAVSNLKTIADKFNGSLDKKLLTVINEASDQQSNAKSEKQNLFSEMRNRITDVIISIEAKYEKRFTSEDFNNYIICTNHVHSVSLNSDDTRYAIFKCSGLMRNTKGYFDKLHKIMKENSNDFMKYLKNIYIPGYKLQFNIPLTEIKKEVMTDGYPALCHFLLYKINSETDINKQNYYDRSITPQMYFMDYKIWYNSFADKRKKLLNFYEFNRELRKFGFITRQVSGGNRYWKISNNIIKVGFKYKYNRDIIEDLGVKIVIDKKIIDKKIELLKNENGTF